MGNELCSPVGGTPTLLGSHSENQRVAFHPQPEAAGEACWGGGGEGGLPGQEIGQHQAGPVGQSEVAEVSQMRGPGGLRQFWGHRVSLTQCSQCVITK